MASLHSHNYFFIKKEEKKYDWWKKSGPTLTTNHPLSLSSLSCGNYIPILVTEFTHRGDGSGVPARGMWSPLASPHDAPYPLSIWWRPEKKGILGLLHKGVREIGKGRWVILV
ncbi:hypothetical protein Hanom_Chr10g00903201 [Helianthus anomalus]